MTAAGQTHPSPQAPAAPTVEDIKDKIDLLQRALNDKAPANSYEDLDKHLAEYEQWREDYQRAGEALQEWTGAADGLDAREQGVVQVGAMVAERAELHAGITADEVQASWQARSEAAKEEYEAAKATIAGPTAKLDAALDKRAEAYRELREVERQFPPESDAVHEARAFYADCEEACVEANRVREAATKEADYYGAMERLSKVEAGRDEQTRADLRRLADGYRTALAEVRELGGELRWHDKTNARARKSFETAVQVYPTEWIEASNARPAPVGKMTKARAHYTDAAYQVTRKSRERVIHYDLAEAEERRKHLTPPNFRSREIVDANGRKTLEVTFMERYSPYRHKMRNGKPAGGRWEEVTYTSHDGEEVTTWWRPQTRMDETSRTVAAQFTTDLSPETSMHELAHRMEASNPQIGQLEALWVARRTTTNGQRDDAEAYSRRHRSERVRPDDFIDRYIGKDYGTRTYHEVLSVGAPMLFLGDRGGMAGVGRHKRDDDMRAFVLGAMASVKAPSTPVEGIAR